MVPVCPMTLEATKGPDGLPPNKNQRSNPLYPVIEIAGDCFSR